MNDCLEFTTRLAAQKCADDLHAKMIEVDPDYARSVAAGHTTAWAIPYQRTDENGVVIGTAWYVNVKDRGRKALDLADLPRLKPILKPVAELETVTKR